MFQMRVMTNIDNTEKPLQLGSQISCKYVGTKTTEPLLSQLSVCIKTGLLHECLVNS